MNDKRNVIDKYKGKSHVDIVADLDRSGVELQVAVENIERDFSMGSIVRSANAFGVRYLHVIGRRQWNKRGAMMTDKYLHIRYHLTPNDFLAEMTRQGRVVIAVDNIDGSVPLGEVSLPKAAVLVFGQESSGISGDIASGAQQIVAIEQFGSTRSVNVGVAAGVAMYAWLQQHVL